MSGPTLSQRVVITNRQGLHARPADMFVRAASQFEARIEVIKDGNRVDGKSILGVLTLVAEEGTELEIEACGPDAQAALKVLSQLVADNFGNGAEH